MADLLGLEIAGERQLALRFERFPEIARQRLRGALEGIEARLEAAVRAAEPSRSGELRSETQGRVVERGDRITAIVSVRPRGPADAGKAAALEYGATRAFEVRAHSAMLAHLWARAIAPITVEVGPYRRTPNIAPQRYLRGPIEAMRGQALAAMKAAVEAAMQ